MPEGDPWVLGPGRGRLHLQKTLDLLLETLRVAVGIARALAIGRVMGEVEATAMVATAEETLGSSVFTRGSLEFGICK